jgi:hypothetical protein
MKKTKRRKHKHQEEKPGQYQKNEYGLHPTEKKSHRKDQKNTSS